MFRQLRRTGIALAIAGIALLTTACGTGDSGAPSTAGETRRIEVSMVDVAFEPAVLKVAKGEEVEFVFTNDGKVRHEAYVGTPDDQLEHEEEMAEAGASSDGHAGHGGESGGSDKVTVEPGKTGTITYRFAEAGTYEIGCHEPGHYAAGMKVTVEVE